MGYGQNTAWGPVQDAEDKGDGIVQVYTAGHGGVYVPDSLLHWIPEDEQAEAAQGGSGPACGCRAAVGFVRGSRAGSKGNGAAMTALILGVVLVWGMWKTIQP